MRVSASGYYGWQGRIASARGLDNARLVKRIGEIHKASQGAIGAPRMHEDLTGEGEKVGRNRVARLMAGDGLQGRPRKRRRGSTRAFEYCAARRA